MENKTTRRFSQIKTKQSGRMNYIYFEQTLREERFPTFMQGIMYVELIPFRDDNLLTHPTRSRNDELSIHPKKKFYGISTRLDAESYSSGPLASGIEFYVEGSEEEVTSNLRNIVSKKRTEQIEGWKKYEDTIVEVEGEDEK